jgi:hypothetical protein
MYPVNEGAAVCFLREEKCVFVFPGLRSASHGKKNFISLEFLLYLARESSSSLLGNFFNFTQKVLHLSVQSSSSRGGEMRLGLGEVSFAIIIK